MLVIIGGKRSSCVYPGTHVLDESVKPEVLGCVPDLIHVVDFGCEETVREFLESLQVRHPHDADCILVVEHAWLALGGRNAPTELGRKASYFVLAHRQFGYAHIILLTREVSGIRKTIRDAADVAFDFSA